MDRRQLAAPHRLRAPRRQALFAQLRAGQTPAHEGELDHWDFGRAYGFSWLDKPRWS